MKVFTDSTIKGRFGVNAIKTKKHLYDYLVFDVVDSYQSLFDMVMR